jgi:hypothetical protein
LNIPDKCRAQPGASISLSSSGRKRRGHGGESSGNLNRRRKTMTKTTINELSAKAKRLTYRAPEAVEIDRTAQLVQGGGGGSGLDYYYYYFLDEQGF